MTMLEVIDSRVIKIMDFKKITDTPKDADKFYRMRWYQVHLKMRESQTN